LEDKINVILLILLFLQIGPSNLPHEAAKNQCCGTGTVGTVTF
jgi:hypothetical protein